ncbi:hypothetical protein KUTeg_005693 [Tegillarca granosa]|uniref:EF-hand domain-containing protein n=1 Tax=Tegillarca granosa TaxID=220873 RepID=A0ABQ9FHG4_TEGGR|nr:hypothetical protein KUTeg_005693 [Tegillarca granosa]
MMGETFFSEVANQDKHGGQGTLTAAEFEHFMGSVIEQMHIRLDSKRDHFFDSEERKKVDGKQREGTVSQKRNAILKGTLGVRWEKARVNESKILPTRKMGIPD